MGWFLSTRKKKRTTRSSYKTSAPSEWDPQRTLRALKYMGITAAVVALVVGWRYAEQFLTGYASERYATAITAGHVQLADAPPWMSEMLRDDLRRLIAGQIDHNPLDSHNLERAAVVLADSPWVNRVERIQRTGHDRLEVYAQYRQPVAAVQGTGGYHLVDQHGVRLPGLYLQHQLPQLDLPVVEGVSLEPAHIGEVWPGNDLQAGLALVDILATQPYQDQVRSIDVSRRDTRGRILLVMHTQHGMVRWGLPPGQEQAIEPAAAIKAKWLADVDRQRGAIDAGGKIVDVYGPAIFVHRPAADNGQTIRTGYTWSR